MTPAWLPLALEARDLAVSHAGTPSTHAEAYRAVLLRLAGVVERQLALLPPPPPPPPLMPERAAGAVHTGAGR